MNFKKSLSLLGALCVLVLLCVFAFKASAQPGGTNTAGYGVHQFNDPLIAPLQPQTTLNEQQSRGIFTGTCVAVTDGTVTNTFPTNYTYSIPPVVIATQTGTLNSSTNIVTKITTTNFVLKSGLASVTNNWVAIGR